MPTEYDNINIIGTTHETSKDHTEKLMNEYYHKQEVKVVTNLLKKMKLDNFENVIDLGSSIGTWYHDFRNFGFKKVIGVDISEERAKIAKKRGYDEVHICNAYDLPFENESKSCFISNDVFVHVLQDSDKLKILKEVKRVLKKNGIFIFNFGNATGGGYETDTNIKYCRWNTPETISKLVTDAGLDIEFIVPSYCASPRIGANKIFAPTATRIIFPIVDSILSSLNRLYRFKVIYFAVRKK